MAQYLTQFDINRLLILFVKVCCVALVKILAYSCSSYSAPMIKRPSCMFLSDHIIPED